MFGRKNVAAVAGDALDSVSPYVDRLAHDEKLRERLVSAIAAGAAARGRARQQMGLRGLALRLGSDPVLRAQVAEAILQLQKARGRMEKARSHKLRNFLLFLTGGGLVIAAVPSLRSAVVNKVRAAGNRDRLAAASPTTVEQEIEVEVPVSTAYNQWTQFEEFPSFMEGVDEVRQLDDTLLHWAATVSGKKAEWDAKILEQVPDRRIVWESVDGKQTRGAVTFEPAGSGLRTRIRLNMSYTPGGITEKVGSAIGLDDRRVRGDLERFRELIEARHAASGAWRGEIKDGQTKESGSAP
ncbi:MAG TPA: SRPBCC family protein [Gaiellaceae bacterium]|nr:SRPBCC family protein [Gaiellaceae bacterium]